LKVLDLFSGIGGISLGLDWAGFKTVGFCEIDQFCRQILMRHWPRTWIHDDVKTLTGEKVQENCGEIDLLAGGFPCQDISVAGKGKGIHADRSGLWWQMRRVISEVRPGWLLIENVPALRLRGADEVLASLEELKYSCWPVVVGAWAVGARHKRDRIWIVGHSKHIGSSASSIRRNNGTASMPELPLSLPLDPIELARAGEAGSLDASHVADTGSKRCRETRRFRTRKAQWPSCSSEAGNVANAHHSGHELQGSRASEEIRTASPSVNYGTSRIENELGNAERDLLQVADRCQSAEGKGTSGEAPGSGIHFLGDSSSERTQGIRSSRIEIPSTCSREGRPFCTGNRARYDIAWRGQEQHPWEESRLIESGLGRAIDGLPRRVDTARRIKALGNSVQPACAEILGRAIKRLADNNG
jgi:DNA-cytosine methyltransferase